MSLDDFCDEFNGRFFVVSAAMSERSERYERPRGAHGGY